MPGPSAIFMSIRLSPCCPPRFEDAQLWLDGELVRSWVAGGDIPYQHVTLAVMFDSSHFEHGESVEVRITGHDNLGRFYDGGASTDVRNIARCWRNWDFAHVDADGVAVAAPNLQLFNYQPIVYYDSWSADFFGDRMFDTITYVVTHGGQGIFDDGPSVDCIYADGPPSIVSYAEMRPLHNGSGLPPYNTTELPPINFLHLESCNCGDDWTFFNACYPYGNVYEPNTYEDQSVWAPTVWQLVFQSRVRTEVIYSYLLAGWTVNEVKGLFLLEAADLEIKCFDIDPDTNDVEPRLMTLPMDIRVSGDLFTRIKSVYTGDYTFAGAWYRDL